jgi:translation elongation factor EF-G
MLRAIPALAFKIATDPFRRTFGVFRAYSGRLDAGSYVLNTRSGNKEESQEYTRCEQAEPNRFYRGR